MKEIKVSAYEAEDGKIFKTEKECIAYEATLNFDKDELIEKVNQFLSNIDNYDDWIKKRLGPDEVHFCEDVFVNEFYVKLYILEDEFGDELDESFCIDIDKWYDFLKTFEKDDGLIITLAGDYWVK